MHFQLTRVETNKARSAKHLLLATTIAERKGWTLDSASPETRWVLKAGRDTWRVSLQVAPWTLRCSPPTASLWLEFETKHPEAIDRLRSSPWYVDLQRKLGSGFEERSRPAFPSGFRLILSTQVPGAALAPIFEKAAAIESAMDGCKRPCARVLLPNESPTFTIARAFLGLKTPWTVCSFLLYRNALKTPWELEGFAGLWDRSWVVRLSADFETDPRAFRPSPRFKAWFSTASTALKAHGYSPRRSLHLRGAGGHFQRVLRPGPSETALFREVQRVDELLDVVPRQGLVDRIPNAEIPRLVLPGTGTRVALCDDQDAARGGALTPRTFLEALRQGFHPATTSAPVCWHSEKRHCILLPARFKSTRRIADLSARGLEITWDRDFQTFLRAVRDETPHPHRWIDDRATKVFSKLHRSGAVHSVEVWDRGMRVGGVFGTELGSAFIVEDGFEKVRGAWALAIRDLARRDYDWIAFRAVRPRYLSVGAETVPRKEYLEKLAAAQKPSGRGSRRSTQS